MTSTLSTWRRRGRSVRAADDGDAVLIVDETADEKSSAANCVGAARQYSGTVGGVALCQVTVTLTYATGRGRVRADRPGAVPA